MDFIERLYKRGLNLYEMLDLNVIYDEAGKRIDNHIPSEIFDKNHIEITNQTHSDNNKYRKIKTAAEYNLYTEIYREPDFFIQTPQEFEEGLRAFEIYKLLERGRNGHFVAFGYSDFNDPCPTVIPIHEWRFLEINREKNIVYYEDRIYRGVKFVLIEQVKKQLTASELDELKMALGVNFKSNEPTSIKDGTNSTAETVPDKRDCQLHIFIWRVYEFLTKDGKATARTVWNEIQFRHKRHDIEGIIQGVTSDVISWCSGYGNKQEFQRSSFAKTLSNLKKKPPF